MKKNLSVLILIIISSLVYGQKTKLIKNKIEKYNELEFYNVLISNKQIKHGSYILKYNWKFYKFIKVKGQYLDGKKDGKWIYFYPYSKEHRKNPRPEYILNYKEDTLNGEFIHLSINGKTLESGSYGKGQRVGEWKIFHSDSLIEHYDFSLSKNLLESRNKTSLDISPKIIDEIDISRYIYKNAMIEPPHKDSSVVKLGRVIIELVVGKDSTIQDVKLQKSSAFVDVDSNLINCIKQTRWEPAIMDNQAVPCRTTIMFIYRIEWQGNYKNWLFEIGHYFPESYKYKPIFLHN